MLDREQLKQKVCETIDQRRERIVGLGESIMDEPELGFKEERTGRKIAAVFAEAGLPCQSGLALTGVKAVLEGGAYSSFGVVTAYYAGAMLPTLYEIPNYKYDGYRVNTNLPPCGAMRGHGCPHPRFAFESLLSMIAEDLGLDPIEVRLRNAMQPESRTCNDLDIHSCEFEACLRSVRERSGWNEKKGNRTRRS